jgi:Protein of unknown function (DUF3298)/Deacetylase PdaC
MKMTFRQNLVMIISLCVVAALFWYGPRVKKAVEVAPTFTEASIQEETTKQEGTSTAPYKIDVVYPVAAGTQIGITGLNTELKKFATDAVDSFKADATTISLYPDEPEFQSALGVKYSIAIATPTLVSVRFDAYQYSAGAAHPISIAYGVTYDLVGNRKLALADLFMKNSSYLQTISDYSIASLKDTFKEEGDSLDSSIEEGASPKQENFEAFIVTPTGLDIIFNPYQVGPYVIGAPEVTIPFDSLKSVIDPAGPLASFIAAPTSTSRY